MKVNSLGKNAILNTVKQGCAILFPFITFIYATRVLGAELVGKYSFGRSIVDYFSLLASLGISNYAVREGARIRDDHQHLTEFVSELFSINMCTTVVSYILLVITLNFSQKLTDYRNVIMIQSLIIVLTTLGVDWVNVVYEDYLYITIRYIVIQLVCVAALFLFVRNRTDIYIYCFIVTMATAGGNILNWFYVRNRIKFKFILDMKLSRHIISILIMFGSTLASVIYLNSDITLLGYLIDDHAVGIYTVASKIYSMSKTLINAAIIVTVPRFSYLLAREDKVTYNNMLNFVFRNVFVFVLPIMLGLYLEAPNVIAVVAGNEFISGTTCLRILCFAILLAVGACFYSYAILLPNKMEKYFLASTIIAAIVNIFLNLYFIPKFGLNSAAVTTLIAEAIILIFCIYFSRNMFKIKISLHLFISEGIGCFLIFLVCSLNKKLYLEPLYELIVSIVGSVLVYFFTLILGSCISKKLK